MSTKRGLTLGKFAPLHKGHQFVIETALRETDEVIAIG
jgi:HTH-type transcriptional regulator, transcriptional repressor of NAD biosynthesis genes